MSNERNERDELAIAAMIEIASAGRGPGSTKYASSKRLCFSLGEDNPRRMEVYLQQLVHAGLLSSCRGPLGGYNLRRPASETTLADIVLAVSSTVPVAPTESPARNAARRALNAAENDFKDNLAGVMLADCLLAKASSKAAA